MDLGRRTEQWVASLESADRIDMVATLADEVVGFIGGGPPRHEAVPGGVEIYVVHVLQVVEALGIKPGEFFRLAYPEVGQPLRPATAELLGAAGPPPDDNFVAQVSAALIQLLTASGTGKGQESPAVEPPGEPAEHAAPPTSH